VERGWIRRRLRVSGSGTEEEEEAKHWARSLVGDIRAVQPQQTSTVDGRPLVKEADRAGRTTRGARLLFKVGHPLL
jgi:hypothetical protein